MIRKYTVTHNSEKIYYSKSPPEKFFPQKEAETQTES